jgi:plasmid maintenance system antidote protein VapI
MSTSEKLKEYIKQNGLRHGYVADKCGINPKKFSRIINGQTKLTVEELETICKKGLSVNPSIFLK